MARDFKVFKREEGTKGTGLDAKDSAGAFFLEWLRAGPNISGWNSFRLVRYNRESE